MRVACWNCVRKHLAQALILIEEARMGYPLHKWLAIGHMAEASSECLEVDDLFANKIRDLRKLYEEHDVPPAIMLLLEEVDTLEAKTPGPGAFGVPEVPE
jgi:hypothetical protein